jgi:hypothetical protein
MPIGKAYLYFHNPPRDWRKDLMKNMQEKEAKNKPPQRPANPAPPLKLAHYAGTYRNPVYGTITITPEQNQLYMFLGVHKQKVLLKPFDRDNFTFTWRLSEESRAAFSIGDDNQAQSLKIDWDAGAVFKRVE